MTEISIEELVIGHSVIKRKGTEALFPGSVVGCWTIIRYNKKITKKNYWVCKCKCGVINDKVPEYTLLYEKSYGCKTCVNKVRKEKATIHGHAKHQLYPRYKLIIGACYDKKSQRYKYYGLIGVTVCDRWRFGESNLTGFQCFLKDIGFKPDMKITRKDKSIGFTPENTIWI